MKLFTPDTEQQLQAQYNLGSSMKQMVICKIFNSYGAGTWYVMNQDPANPDYLWGIAVISEPEIGSFSKSELESIRISIGVYKLGLERDLNWEARSAQELWERLVKVHCWQ